MIALSRRQFLGTTAAAFAVSGARAVEPIVRKGPARLRLSLAAYSFRQYFRDGRDSEKAQTPAARQIDLFQFIDFCAEQGCDGTELTSYYFPKDFDDAFLLKLRHHAFIRGVSVSGTAVGNTFTLPGRKARSRDRLGEGMDRAREAAGGSPYPGFRRQSRGPNGWPTPSETASRPRRNAARHRPRRECSSASRTTAASWRKPTDLLEIIRAVRSPWVGINLDTGNFHSADPYADLERCVPYAVNVQVKVEIRGGGQARGQRSGSVGGDPARRALPGLGGAGIRGRRGSVRRGAAASEGPR
jgi:hypothetical protein